MKYSLYVRNEKGAYTLTDTAEDYDEAIEKYAAIIKYSKIQDVLMTENLPYTVTYDSQTEKYTANYPEEPSEPENAGVDEP